ncbi:MAG: hypothetical protein LBU69_01700 [Deltaproteobacteria bacterium]|nr:hypothetical protein [Deltaproteobacteria bacterium]
MTVKLGRWLHWHRWSDNESTTEENSGYRIALGVSQLSQGEQDVFALRLPRAWKYREVQVGPLECP